MAFNGGRRLSSTLKEAGYVSVHDRFHLWRFHSWLFSFIALFTSSPLLLTAELQLLATESDPDAFIQGCVNVINGAYCECATDLLITAPDALLLQRFYSPKDPITGSQMGTWRMFPQRFLIVGDNPTNPSSTLAFTGERSGGILPYSGCRSPLGITQEPLKIDPLNAPSMVNTYAKEINGQNNHQNNRLHCKGGSCELVLGDSSQRIYTQVAELPTTLFGEELTPLMSDRVIRPEYYLLTKEILPSGNQLLFTYDATHRLTAIEMWNSKQTNLHAWIHFTYDFYPSGCIVHLETSDAKSLTYTLARKGDLYQLTQVEGSHLLSTAYTYQDETLVRKTLPEGRFLEIEYADGKVSALKNPHPLTRAAETLYTFSYGHGYTDCFNALGIKTRYHYDKRDHLTAVERYDEKHTLYRIDKKFWGKNGTNIGRLLARTVEDGKGRVYSYRSLEYDTAGNVLAERLYGNLTGKQEVSLQVTSDGLLLNAEQEECHLKTYEYSTDGLNLLTKTGDSKGCGTQYTYQSGTNLLIKKILIGRNTSIEKFEIKQRTFHTYNEDGVCIQTIEDDCSLDSDEKSYDRYTTEKQIRIIVPKTTLPGVGLPEILEEKALDLKSNQELLIKKLVNIYDAQSNLLSCSTYDNTGEYAYTESNAFNTLGQVVLEIDAAGRETHYTYDGVGNRISCILPAENREIVTTYDLHNHPVTIAEITADSTFTTYHSYDLLDRKVSSVDRYGNVTSFTYDSFNRLTQVTHPEVVNEENQLIRPTFKYTYDIFGNATSIEDPNGFITTRTYTLHGHPSRVNYPDNTCDLFKYDKEGSLHRSMTRDQLITVYEYDYRGRPIYEEIYTSHEKGTSECLFSRSHRYTGFRSTYAKDGDQTQTYSYDYAGRLTSLEESGMRSKGNMEKVSRLTEFFYDSLNRVHKKKVWYGFEAEEYALECFEYDLLGNATEKRIEDAQGNILIRKGFAYDQRGQCIEEYSLENNRKTTLLKTLYDGESNPVLYIDALGQETRIFLNHTHQNALGQLVLKKTLVDSTGVQTEIEFDALSRVYAVSKKDQMGVLFFSQKTFYDALGNSSSEVQDQVVNGRIVGTQKTRRIYGPMGRLDEEILAADSSIEKRTRYSYNALGRLSSQQVAGTPHPILYHYNKDGNLHKIEVDNEKKELWIANYYSYDKRGNIISSSCLGKMVKRSYNVFNQLLEEEIKDGEGGSYTLKYAYDRKGRLTEIELPDQSKIVYLYDAVFGREVRRLSPTGEILYTHTYDQYDEQGKLLTETLIGNLGTREYTYDLNGERIATKQELFSEQYVRDSLGRLVQVEGAHRAEYSYNVLSQIISETKEKVHTYAYDSIDNRIKANEEEFIYNSLNQLIKRAKGEYSYDLHGNLLRKVLDGEESHFQSNIMNQLLSVQKKKEDPATCFSYDPFGRMLVQKQIALKGRTKTTLSTTRYLYVGYQEIGSFTDPKHLETLKIPGLQGDTLAPTSVAFELKDQLYAPIHDVVGNVTHLLDPESKQEVESYAYTTFGEETIYNVDGEISPTSPLGNPWRFAEKRFEQKTGLILFGLRFYDPVAGRWISPDPVGFLDGPNLYAYLHNNPVNALDRFGLATESNGQKRPEKYLYGEIEPHCFCETHRCCRTGGDAGATCGSNLPKIWFCHHFEEGSPATERSRPYDLRNLTLPELPPDLGIGFINGIMNPYEDSQGGALHISRLSGGFNIQGVYNQTHGFLRDPLECLRGLNYVATEPVRQLHRLWSSFFERSSANAKFLMICHSQGAIHVRNALLSYPKELRERILVIAIAPAAYIYKETCAKVIHYRAQIWRDFIPRIDILGAIRSRDTIVTLDSHTDAPMFDHAFMSPTYEDVLKGHTRNYITSHGQSL